MTLKSVCVMSFREKAQIMKKTGVKRVLLLGSGYVSGPIVEYLTRDERTQVTVGEFVFKTLKSHNFMCCLWFQTT